MDQMNQTPNTTPVPPMPSGAAGMKKGGSTSSLVAIVVIVALLVLGGIYYLMVGAPTQQQNDTMPTAAEVQNSTDPEVQAAMSQSQADDLDSIQADANATNLGGIDAAVSDVNSAQ